MKIKPLEEIKSVCSAATEALGVIVADVEFKNGKNPSLTIFIDKAGGVDLDTCASVSDAIDAPLDALDPTFGQPYTLNVSSLGADRAFKTDEDFNSHIGKMVEVKLKAPIAGKKFYEGVLCSYTGDAVTVKVDEKRTLTIYLKNTVKVNEYIDMNA